MEKYYTIIRIICILYFYTLIAGNICSKKLDAMTRCKGDNILTVKYAWMFFLFNYLNYYFIDKIKEGRKIDYYIRYITDMERLSIRNKAHNISGDFDYEDKEKIRNMKLYLKIKKIKKNIK